MLHRGCPCRVMGDTCVLYRGHPGGTAGARAGISREVPGHSVIGGALASCLKQKWCGPGVFENASHLCPLGTAAGAVVRAIWGCAGVNLPGSSLVRLLGLVGARGLGLTDVVG